jgi:hypothetical protein
VAFYLSWTPGDEVILFRYEHSSTHYVHCEKVGRIEQAGGNIMGGRLACGLEVDDISGDITAVVSKDREGNATVHPADAVIFAISIKGL